MFWACKTKIQENLSIKDTSEGKNCANFWCAMMKSGQITEYKVYPEWRGLLADRGTDYRVAEVINVTVNELPALSILSQFRRWSFLYIKREQYSR
jgi:hypothetical protein